MVFVMKTGEAARELHWQSDKEAPVKVEVVSHDQFVEEHGPLAKRSKLSSPLQYQGGVECADFIVPPIQYNPLDEPSPLGLSLRKSPSLLDLIQMRLSQGKTESKASKREQRGGSSSATEKLKASNFPATVLAIGSWEYKSRYEGDLVAKCYFAKHKLVWEVLDGGLKNKIEIQWSDILWLKATYPEDAPGTLDVVLARQPLFFRETNPQPRKHTLWQATSDFTGGQASVYRRHYLQCPQGLLGRHFEKLIQCDPRLNILSQQPEIKLDSLFFESKRPSMSIFEDLGESITTTPTENPAYFTDLCDTNSHSSLESFPQEAPSPCSVTDVRGMEGGKEWAGLQLHPSMSMSDLVTHLEQRVSEQNPDRHSLEILEEINRCLFSDTQPATSDEKSLMSRVNSLCSLLQKDAPPPAPTVGDDEKREEEEAGPSLTRKDSVGELLLNLPRITSLPKFLFNISEDSDCPRAR